MVLRLKTNIPYGEWMRVCRALGLDGDKVLSGEADLAESAYPGRTKAYALAGIMCRGRRKMRHLTDEQFEASFAIITGNFLRYYMTAQEVELLSVLKRLHIRLRWIWRTRWFWKLVGKVHG